MGWCKQRLFFLLSHYRMKPFNPNINNVSKTLIIIDWDDTLFPTTWIGEHKINVGGKLLTGRLRNFFSKLDILLYRLLENLSKCGKIVIVTNAAKRWVYMSVVWLPLTQKLLNNRIAVISARDTYKPTYPNDMYMWKRLVYKNLMTAHLMKNVHLNHVWSIGDAEYEYRALVELDGHKLFKDRNFKHMLKAVKLIRYPSLELLLDQLILLNRAVPQICNSRRHMDLVFKPIRGAQR